MQTPPARRSRFRARARLIGVALAAAVVASGCATSLEINIDRTAAGPAPLTSDAPAPTPTSAQDPPAPSPAPTPTPVPELGYDEAIDVYFADVERYWGEVGDVLGITFEPVQRRVPYDPSEVGGIPPCGGEIGPREIYVGNAFYCGPDDFIAWDDVGLFPDLYRVYGDFTVGMVIAHEYGHAIQARTDTQSQTIFLELQADCFAGAWAGDVAERATVPFDPADLDEAVAGFLTFADPVGTSAADPAAHGTALDRLNALADGFDGGVEACPRFVTSPPQTSSILIDRRDQNQGNFPLADLLPLLVDDLTAYLDGVGEQLLGPAYDPPTTFGEFGSGAGDPADCGGRSVDPAELDGSAYYCELTQTVAADLGELDVLWAEVGDFAPAYTVAHAYALSIAAELNDDVVDAVLLGDCLVGDWARDVFEDPSRPEAERTHLLILSAGDLDEGIVGLLQVPAVGPSLEPTGAIPVFDRVSAFGDGFFGGLGAC